MVHVMSQESHLLPSGVLAWSQVAVIKQWLETGERKGSHNLQFVVLHGGKPSQELRAGT